MNHNKLTVEEARRTFHKSRQTIYNAINSGELSAHKERVSGRETTLIDYAELLRVYGEPLVQELHNTTSTQVQVADKIKLTELSAQLEKEQELRKVERQLREKAEESESRAIEQAEHWRRQAEQNSLLLTDERSQSKKVKAELETFKNQPKRKWWQFLNFN